MRSSRLLSIGIVVFVLDILTKNIALQFLSYGEPVPVISGFFDLTLVYNKGAAFGMFSGLSDVVRRAVLGAVSVVAMAIVVRLMFWESRGDRYAQVALSAILGGAVGNMVDRVRYDYVIDFLDFYVASYHWPAFNIADSAISVGVCILLVRMVFAPESKKLDD